MEGYGSDDGPFLPDGYEDEDDEVDSSLLKFAKCSEENCDQFVNSFVVQKCPLCEDARTFHLGDKAYEG
jgi:hypothetical protein